MVLFEVYFVCLSQIGLVVIKYSIQDCVLKVWWCERFRESGPQVFNPLFLFTSKGVTLEEVIMIGDLILNHIAIWASVFGDEIHFTDW